MSRQRTRTELVRDAALDDDFSIDRALVLVKRLNYVYGEDRATKKVLTELADILIGVRARARATHQDAERLYQAEQDEREQVAQLL
jgi:protein-disulfide isomerase-like protein with CxxC motif